ncbi:MAG TPA: hypothetical protein VF032_16175 [Thermoleophilaceae bacterium]
MSPTPTGKREEVFFIGRQDEDARPALMAWRASSLNVRTLEPLAYFADDHSAEYFWSLLEQVVRDAAATGETGLLEPPGPSASRPL